MRSRLAWAAASWLAGYLLVPAYAGAAPEATDFPESSRAAYAASAAFDLQPRVEHASFHLRRPELQALYNAIGQAFGIRLLYDRDFKPVRVVNDFQLEDVTLQQALDAASNVSRTFVAPVDEHTGIVASDTSEKRGEYERQVLGSFPVEDQITAQQMTEISTALRTMLDLRRVAQDARSNSITVLGRSRQVEAAREFLDSVQKERGEVIVELDIMEIDSQRARELGVLPPQPVQLVFLGASGAGIVPLPALRTGAALFGVQLPGASLPLTFSTSALHSLQKAELRASDGQEASLLVGDRVPILNGIVSSSFFLQGSQTTGAGLTGFFPSVQYQDVGVIMKATPYLHSARELTLKLDLALREVSSQNLNGAPVISNRQVTEQFRVRDGETYVIGGILNRSQDRSVSGYPGLWRLPLLGALFGTHTRHEAETELLLVVRPHIIRRSAAEEYASNLIYFGKELQGLPAAPPPPPPPQEQPVPAPPPPGQPQPFPFQPGVPQQQPGVPPQPGAVPPGFQPGIQPAVPPGGRPQIGFPPQIIPGMPPGIQPQPAQPQQQQQQ